MFSYYMENQKQEYIYDLKIQYKCQYNMILNEYPWSIIDNR